MPEDSPVPPTQLLRVLVLGTNEQLSATQLRKVESGLDRVVGSVQALDYDDTELLILDADRGVDAVVRRYAEREAMSVQRVRMDWSRYGLNARSKAVTHLLEFGPRCCLGFPLGACLDVRKSLDRVSLQIPVLLTEL